MAPASSRHVLVPMFVAALVLSLPAAASAQEVGVKAGVNFASLTPEEDEDPDMSRLPGFVGGLWIRIARSGRFSFQGEGLFSEKGVTVEAPSFGGPFDIRVRYLEIPLLARADLGADGSSPRAFVAGGVAPAFKLSAHTKFVLNGVDQTRDIDRDIYSADVGLVGAAGIDFRRALIEARYTHGLRHINTDDNGDEDRIKNRVFSVTVGFRVR